MNKNLFLIFTFIIVIIFSTYFCMSKSNTIFEGIYSRRLIDIAVIINDDSLSPETKIDMIKLMDIGDTRYRNIINNPDMKNKDKVSSLLKIYT